MFANNQTYKPRPVVAEKRKLTPEEIAENLDVGIVLHDNSNLMADGWAFLPDKPPMRVRGLMDLPSGPMWISSGDFADFSRRGSVPHHVRRTSYIGLRLSEIANDLGIRIDGGHAQEGGAKIAPYVQQAVRLAVAVYGLDDPLRQLQDDTLVSTIVKALPPSPPSKEMMLSKLKSAYQPWSSKFVGFMDNTASVRLRFARVPYAQWLLSNPVPDSGWSHIYNSQGFDHDKVIDGTFPPTLIEAVVEFDQVSVEIAELVAYGVGGPAKSRNRRAWMTDVEYRWITQFARVHVISYLMANNVTPLPQVYCLPEKIVADPILAQSVSVGLLSYAHWQALVASKWSRISQQSEYDINATWLRAHDRAKCFEAAFILQQQGFHVQGYGNGSVLVRADRSRLPDLAQTSIDLGMAFPKWNALRQEFGYANADYSD